MNTRFVLTKRNGLELFADILIDSEYIDSKYMEFRCWTGSFTNLLETASHEAKQDIANWLSVYLTNENEVGQYLDVDMEDPEVSGYLEDWLEETEDLESEGRYVLNEVTFNLFEEDFPEDYLELVSGWLVDDGYQIGPERALELIEGYRDARGLGDLEDVLTGLKA